MAGDVDPALSTACPRCGYDLRGTVATWAESCPLHGVCTECGLELSWAETLRPEKFEPRWCIEFEPTRMRLVPAALKTFLRSFVPWRFWRQIRMAHPIRWSRLAMYGMILLVPLFLVYAVAQTMVAIEVRKILNTELQDFQQILIQSGSAQTVSQDIDHSAIEAIVEAVFLPFARKSWGTVQIAQGWWIQYPAPRELHGALSSESAMSGAAGAWVAGLGRPRVGNAYWLVSSFARSSLLWEGLAIGLFVLMPASLLLLPISRRRAKVRWAHIGRVFVYSLFIMVLVPLIAAGMLGCALLSGRDQWGQSEGMMFFEAGLQVQRFAPLVLLPSWWAIALGSYLKLPRGWLIALLHALLIYMLMIAAIWLIDPEYMTEISGKVFPSWMLGV